MRLRLTRHRRWRVRCWRQAAWPRGHQGGRRACAKPLRAAGGPGPRRPGWELCQVREIATTTPALVTRQCLTCSQQDRLCGYHGSFRRTAPDELPPRMAGSHPSPEQSGHGLEPPAPAWLPRTSQQMPRPETPAGPQSVAHGWLAGGSPGSLAAGQSKTFQLTGHAPAQQACPEAPRSRGARPEDSQP